MSDNGRQSMTDKVSSSMKPDSQKGMVEQAGDMVSGTMDSAAAALQPNSQKSNSQRVGDSITGKGNTGEDSLLNKAKNSIGMGSNSNNSGSNNNN